MLVGTSQRGVFSTKDWLYRWWNVARECVNDASPTVVVAMARAGGHLIRASMDFYGSALLVNEVPVLIKLLAVENAGNQARFAALLILAETARQVPTELYASVNEILDTIFLPLRDPRPHVRDGAARLLEAGVGVLLKRDRGQVDHPVLVRLLRDAEAGLRSVAPDTVHGSLLAIRGLITAGKDFMRPRFAFVAESTLRLHAHKDSNVRRAAITLVPILAEYEPDGFCAQYLDRSMRFLLDHLERNLERDATFVSIGHLARNVHSEMRPHLQAVLDHVFAALHPHGRKPVPPGDEETALDCLTMIATAVGPMITKPMSERLDLLFACSLTMPLLVCLHTVMMAAPALKPVIQGRLLNMLSLKLTGLPYREVGSLPRRTDEKSATMDRTVRVNQDDPPGVILALRALAGFDFQGHVLTELVRDAVLPYLEDEDPAVRVKAAQTACLALRQDKVAFQTSNYATEIISAALTRILGLAIADPDPGVRKSMLLMLDTKFDRMLANDELLHAVFMAIHDEVFANRLLAVELIGRLCTHNEGITSAWLRKTLVQLTTELQHTSDPDIRERTAHIIMRLAIATKPLIEPYALALLQVLMPRANDDNPTVAAHALTCIGELATVARADFEPFVEPLMNTMIGIIGDPTGQIRRGTALKALAQLCASTGCVVNPLVEYPKLLPALHKILELETDEDLRSQVLRVLGVIGAIDPSRLMASCYLPCSHAMADALAGSRVRSKATLSSSSSSASP